MPTPFIDRIRLRISRSAVYLRARDLVMRSGRGTYWVVREDLARRYLSGDGIEIGVLTAPLRTPPGVRVRYVDRLSRDELISQEGPSLQSTGVNPETIVAVDFVEDAERLVGIADRSVDFAIALHVLEHLEDPIEALTNLVRVVRPGGRLLIALPEPRLTFDRHRERTTVEHLLDDHESGPARSRADHHLEWARDIEGLRGEQKRCLGRAGRAKREEVQHR